MDQPDYGQTLQYAKINLNAALTSTSDQIKFLQRVTSKFLLYAQAVNNTMMHALNNTAFSADVKSTYKDTDYFLNYVACNPNAEIIYCISAIIILQADSNVEYLVSSRAWSRAGRYHFLGNTACTQFNDPVLILAKVIKMWWCPQ